MNTNPQHPITKTYRFHTSSKNADLEEVSRMVNSSNEVLPKELLQNCQTALVEHHLGYNQDFPIENDHHVKFYRSTYKGVPCFYIVHSGIEYIFTKQS